MAEPINDEIPVVEARVDEKYGPEIGDADYWIDETEYREQTSVFGLEEGNYEMNAVELDRNLRELSQRAYMTSAEDGAVFFAEGEFMYVNIEDIDHDEGLADVNIRKGSYREFIAEVGQQNNSAEVSEGFFDRIVEEEVEMDKEELARQRSQAG
jgi:hypothetical protein